MGPPLMPTLHRQNSADREAFLIDFTTNKCSAHEEITLDEGWAILIEYGIDVVANILSRDLVDKKPFGNKGFAALYTVVYQMCSNTNSPDQSGELYERVNTAIDSFLRKHVVAPLLDPSLVGIGMLAKFSKAWRNHKIMTKWIQHMFHSLDRGYVVNSGAESITSCGMIKFLEVGFGDTCSRVRAGVLEMINRERGGDIIDRDQLATCIEVFVVMGLCRGPNARTLKTVDMMLRMQPELDVYIVDFETPFLRSTEAYYESKGSEWQESDSVPEYLARVEHALAEEQQRVAWYLEASTEPKLQLVCVKTLLCKPQAGLVQREGSGLYVLLMDDKQDDLARMFRLFQLPGVDQGVAPMTVVFEQFVTDRGEALIEARRAEVKRLVSEKKKESLSDCRMIKGLIALHAKVHALVVNVFNNHIDFQKALGSAFRRVMNADVNIEAELSMLSNVELLAAYCDMILKGHEGKDRITEEVMEERLEASIRLFMYLADKDVFKEHYRDALAKRLTNKKTTSMEVERHMISRMKQTQGKSFTNNLEGMFADFVMCKDNNDGFSNYLQASAQTAELTTLSLESTVSVLTQGHWPRMPNFTVVLPENLRAFQVLYEDYFHTVQDNKRLAWQLSLGDAEVHGKFPKLSYRILVNTLQAITLAGLSEAHEPVSFTDVCQRLWGCGGAAPSDVKREEVTKRVLHSLACNPKFKVLRKSGPGKPNIIHVEDSFVPNPTFTCKTRRFTIPMASLENVGQQVKKKVEEDRSYQIDASVVRTMKARKVMAHHGLVGEVAAQLQTFRAKPADIKRRIESLIDREYLRRIEEDGQWTKQYEYLA